MKTAGLCMLLIFIYILQDWQTGEFEATAYCSCAKCCGTHADGMTSTGIKLADGMAIVAVDPTVIPLGSEVYVPGYGLALAEDVGGAIKGKRIDVFFWTHEQALQWGRKKGVRVHWRTRR